MPNLTIKNVPQALYRSLKESAAAHRRSINGEVIVCLERTLGAPRVNVRAVLERARALRHRLSGFTLMDPSIDKAKRWGRA